MAPTHLTLHAISPQPFSIRRWLDLSSRRRWLLEGSWQMHCLGTSSHGFLLLPHLHTHRICQSLDMDLVSLIHRALAGSTTSTYKLTFSGTLHSARHWIWPLCHPPNAKWRGLPPTLAPPFASRPFGCTWQLSHSCIMLGDTGAL